MNKIIITSLVVVLSTFAFAQRRGNVRKGTDVPRQSATENKILLEQLPKRRIISRILFVLASANLMNLSLLVSAAIINTSYVYFCSFLKNRVLVYILI